MKYKLYNFLWASWTIYHVVFTENLIAIHNFKAQILSFLRHFSFEACFLSIWHDLNQLLVLQSYSEEATVENNWPLESGMALFFYRLGLNPCTGVIANTWKQRSILKLKRPKKKKKEKKTSLSKLNISLSRSFFVIVAKLLLSLGCRVIVLKLFSIFIIGWLWFKKSFACLLFTGWLCFSRGYAREISSRK